MASADANNTAQHVAWVALALLAGGAVTILFVRSRRGHKPAPREIGVVGLVLSVTWWIAAANLNQTLAARYAATSLLGFAVGGGIGFLFTSYEDEAASIGKVRDWLLGGIVALTFGDAVKGFGNMKALLEQLAGGKTVADAHGGIGQHAAMLVSYAALGFYAMFLHRELTLNPLLQAKRNDRKRLEEEGRKVTPALALADASRDDADPTGGREELAPDAARSLTEFIAAAQEARSEGQELDPATKWKLARAYFHREQYEKAIPLLEKAMSEPEHAVEARLKLAQAYGEMSDQKKAVETLEVLANQGPTRPAVLKLLGYYLLWIDERLGDAIKYTKSYLDARPTDSGAIFNLACAYAQKFGKTHGEDDKAWALEYLGRAIEIDAPWKLRAASLAGADADFAALKDDPGFQELVKAS